MDIKLNITIERLDVHHHGATEDQLRHILERLVTMSLTQAEQTAALQKISDGLATLSTGLSTTSDQLTKGLGEVKDEIAALQAAAGGNSTPEMDALFTSIGDKLAAVTTTAGTVATTAQAIDDLNPDGPAAP